MHRLYSVAQVLWTEIQLRELFRGIAPREGESAAIVRNRDRDGIRVCWSDSDARQGGGPVSGGVDERLSNDVVDIAA